MTRFGSFLAVTLALIIAVTSQQMAVARGTMKDAQGQVVLCTGQGPMTVTLDAQGNPVGPVEICPDCVMTLLDAASPFCAGSTAVVHMQTLVQSDVILSQITITPREAMARGPPVFV